MASLRMGLVFLILIPFWKFRFPEKKFFKPLILFSISMGVLVYVFMNLSLYNSSIIAPIILGSQLAIPFGILASSFMLNEHVSKNKWFLIFLSYLGLIFAGFMALFFGLAQVYSRQLKELPVSMINASTGIFGFIILLIFSLLIEGDVYLNLKQINYESWLLISYQAIIVSLCAHLLMFYLYKFYTVGQIFPFYSLFPIFGIILTYLVFGEVPTILFILGGIIVISSVFFLQKIK
jgi:O-acetylserine/cysteine efflux transporter